MIVKLSFLVIHYHYHPFSSSSSSFIRLSGFSHFWQCLMHWLTVSVIVFTSESLLTFVWPVYTCTLYYHTANQAQISRMHKLKVTTKCFIDYLLVTEVSAPIPGIICFSKGSPKGISCVSRDSIGFPKEIFGSPKGVSQIRISLRVRQMMYVDQFKVFCCTNRSIIAAHRCQTSRFNVGFSGGNSKQTIKQP